MQKNKIKWSMQLNKKSVNATTKKVNTKNMFFKCVNAIQKNTKVNAKKKGKNVNKKKNVNATK